MTYDIYGDVLAWRALHNLPPPSFNTNVGHKGLHFERLDLGATIIAGISAGDISPSGEIQYATPQIAAHARGLYHVRNRWLDPKHGRWLTRDPNASGQHVQGLAFHGDPRRSGIMSASLAEIAADGSSLYEYGRSNSIKNSDPTGLFIGFADVLGGMGWQSELQSNYGDTMSDTYKSVGGSIKDLFGSVGWQQSLGIELATSWDFYDDDAVEYTAGGIRFKQAPEQAQASTPGIVVARAVGDVGHHIATKYGARGTRFKALFANADLDIDDKANLVDVLASVHKRKKGTKSWAGSSYHDPNYHGYVEKTLTSAVAGKTPHSAEYKEAFRNALKNLENQINANPKMINDFATYGPPFGR